MERFAIRIPLTSKFISLKGSSDHKEAKTVLFRQGRNFSIVKPVLTNTLKIFQELEWMGFETQTSGV